MPVNYADAKIYKIEPICSHDESDVYYGSTCRVRLCDRYKGHLADYKQTHKKMTITSRFIFDKYKVENCHIVLVEAFPCANRDELTARESVFIRTLPCINKCIPNVSADERKEHLKKYYLAHKAERDDYVKKYNIAHKTERDDYVKTHKAEKQQYDKEYKLKHKAELKAKKQQYYEKNKVSIALKRKNHYEATKLNK